MNFFPASEKDISLLQNLAKKSWEVGYADILSAEQIAYMLKEMYGEKEILSHLHNPNYHYFLVQEGKENLGFIGFEHQYEPKTTKLHRLYLLPEAKGKGYGKSTLSFLKDKVLETGDSRIILNVNKENSAKKVYESQGFKVYDEGVFDIGEGFIMDDYLMEFVF